MHFNSNAKMKILSVALFISTINISIKCDAEEMIKHPKKVKSDRSIKIINASKFNKLQAREKGTAIVKTVKYNGAYTVFPPIAERRLDEPGILYIHGNVDTQRKPRVKKVLPEYSSISRKKRSANNTSFSKASIETKDEKELKRIKKLIPNKVPYIKKKVSKKKSNATKLKMAKANNKSSIKLKYTRKSNKTLRPRSGNNKTKLKKTNQVKKDDARRLIAAKDALIEEYPYVVSIQKGGEHWCAGALLNPRIVITTANCVWKARSVSRMRIRAGSRHMERGGQVARIQEVVKHPDWSIRGQPDYDVALLLLDRNIQFSDSVHGVDLPNRAMLPAFEDAWVTSWGSDRRDGIFQTVGVTLQVYHAMLIDHNKCNNITQRFGVAVSRNFICLAQTGRRAPCTRDTGAPAVSDGILWGLASWGIRKLCGTERFPAMFSYLASRSNLDFITNATHYLMSDKRFYPYNDRYPLDRAGTTVITTTRS